MANEQLRGILGSGDASPAARQAAVSGNEPSDAVRVVNALLTQLDQLRRLRGIAVVQSRAPARYARDEPCRLCSSPAAIAGSPNATPGSQTRSFSRRQT